jgi:hypothetical protein
MRFELNEVNNKHISGEDCFCIFKEGCHADLMDISYCKQDAPIFISKPHFLDAEQYTEKIKGLSPSREKHQAWIDVEPWTGIPLSASVKFQVNVETQPETEMYPMTYPKKIVPLLWFEQVAIVDNNASKKLKSRLFNKISMFRAVTGIMILGGAMVGIGVAFLYFTKRRKGFFLRSSL